MERAGRPHRTRIYLSIDAPHRGTYTSLGVQWFVHALRPLARALQGFADLLDAPSNQQLMIAWLHDGAVGTSPLRDAFLAELEELGHPQQPTTLAVACGRGDGVPAGGAGARTLTLSAEPFLEVALNTLPGDSDGVVACGSWLFADPGLQPLTVAGAPAWETAPGSQNTYNAQVAAVASAFGCGTVEHAVDVACGVPTASALDLDQDPFAPVPDDAGPFDAHVCSATNVQHLAITPEVSKWIVDRLGAPPAPAGPGGRFDPYTFDPHAPAFSRDPYPTYRSFREEAPQFVVGSYASRWFFRHADCEAILTGTERFVKTRPGGSPPPPGPTAVMRAFPTGVFSADPPRHGPLRAQLEPPLREAITRAPELAARRVAPVIDRAAAAGHLELVADCALPVPANVVFDLLGIPDEPEVRLMLIAWQAAIVRANDRTNGAAALAKGATAAMALHHYLEGLVRLYATSGGPGLIGDLATRTDDALSLDDVHMSCFDFVVAGYLSTTYLIASGMKTLLEHPDQLDALRADPARMPGAIEEMLRFEPPLQLVDRYAAADTELGGVPVHAGDRVTAVIGSAARDPEVFPDSEAFDIGRPDVVHLSFGDGIHQCIGAPLARLLAPAVISALLELPGPAIAGLAQWQSDPYLRGMLNLPLRFAA
jgi:cytochrome P450